MSQAVHEYDAIHAICNHEPGGDNDSLPLYVMGAVVFRETGWEVEVRPFTGDAGSNAKDLALELVFIHHGEFSGDALIRVEFRYDGVSEGVEYDTASFTVRGTDDSPPAPVPFNHVERTS
jgi:hypothetical protein